MGAYIVCLTENQWEVLQPILAHCCEGAILVPPAAASAFELDEGFDVWDYDGDLLEKYDFGGCADVALDVLHDNCVNQQEDESFGAEAIIAYRKEQLQAEEEPT